VDQAVDAVGVERRLAHKQLIQDHTKRPQVHLR
jgi:hypothetical protein